MTSPGTAAVPEDSIPAGSIRVPARHRAGTKYAITANSAILR